jgi:hypothetical protein
MTRETIVNAVAHLDYTSNGSVQVMPFSDRLEVWNPGTLPPTLTLARLRLPQCRTTGTGILPDRRLRHHHMQEAGAVTQSGHPPKSLHQSILQ